MSARIIYSAKVVDTGTLTIPEDVDYLVVQLAVNYYRGKSSSDNTTYSKSPSFPDEGFKVTRGQSIYLPVTKAGTEDEQYITATFNEDGTLKVSACGNYYYAYFNVSGYAYEVEPPVSVTLDRESFVLPKGGVLPLHAVVRPSYARPSKASWSVVPTGIVGVPEGAVNTASVEAAADGTAVVRASAGDKYAECSLTVRGTDATIKTALNGTDVIPWMHGNNIQSVFMPLTVKKTGLTLYRLSFTAYVGSVTPTTKFELKKYGADEVLLSASAQIDKSGSANSNMGTFAFYLHYPLEKDVEYQLCFSSEQGFNRPLVAASYVQANDYVDISTGSAYYNDENTALFAGIIGLIEEV